MGQMSTSSTSCSITDALLSLPRVLALETKISLHCGCEHCAGCVSWSEDARSELLVGWVSQKGLVDIPEKEVGKRKRNKTKGSY